MSLPHTNSLFRVGDLSVGFFEGDDEDSTGGKARGSRTSKRTLHNPRELVKEYSIIILLLVSGLIPCDTNQNS